MEFNQLLEKVGEVGVVIEINNTIITIVGLPGAHMHELVVFEDGGLGEVFLLDQDSVAILLLGNISVRVGSRLTRTNQFISIPVGTEILGQVIDPLGNSIEGKPYKKPKDVRELDVLPPKMSDRVRIT